MQYIRWNNECVLLSTLIKVYLVFKHFCYQYFARKRTGYGHSPTKEVNNKNLKIVVIWGTTTRLTPSTTWACIVDALGAPPTLPFPGLCTTLSRIALWMATSFFQRLYNYITGCKVLQPTFICANKTFYLDSVFTMLSSQRVGRGMIYYHLVNSLQFNNQSNHFRKQSLLDGHFSYFSPCFLLLLKMASVSEATSDSAIRKSYHHHCVLKARWSWCQKEGWVYPRGLDVLGLLHTRMLHQPPKEL